MTKSGTKSGLSTELEPRPLREGQVAVFKLVTAGRIDPATDKPSFNSGAYFHGETTIYDKNLKDYVILKNKSGEELGFKDGKSAIIDKIDQIEFDAHGFCRVKHNEPYKYIFLSRHDYCGSNKFRDNSKPIMWEQILDVNIKEKEFIALDLSLDAQLIIRDGDHNTVLAIGKSLAEAGIVVASLDLPIYDLRRELMKYAKEHPKEVINASKDKAKKVLIDILDAQKWNIIAFEQENNEWVWCDKFGKEKVITTIEPGHDPIKRLAEIALKQAEDNKLAKAEDKQKTILTQIKESLKELV